VAFRARKENLFLFDTREKKGKRKNKKKGCPVDQRLDERINFILLFHRNIGGAHIFLSIGSLQAATAEWQANAWIH
jgi:hypothetical protein